jgi:hypothetical protein
MEYIISVLIPLLGGLAPTTWFLLLGLLFSFSFLRKALS